MSALLLASLLFTVALQTQAPLKWITTWTASAQGPYPSGNASAQPDQRFAFPTPASGARDQTFRMVVRPDVWGRQLRVRLSNAFGTRPVTIDEVYAGVQLSGAALLPRSNRPVHFGGKSNVTIPAGQDVWSDAADVGVSDVAALSGRKLVVSFHV